MRLTVAAIIALTAFSAQAQYYKTLPKGVRAAVYRQVVTNEVDSNFNNLSNLNPISYDVEINSDTINSIDDQQIQQIFSIMKDADPEIYKNMTAGAFNISGSGSLKVDAYGMGYGVSNKVTAYFALPMYEASTKLKYRRTKYNNFEETADKYQTKPGNDMASWVGGFAAVAPDVLKGETVQNMLVNEYGYQELGDWEGKGPGDLEFGLMYNFFSTDKYGLMITGGVTAPTGVEDDPDILQDIPFGDGQWDGFAEFGGGYILSNSFILNSYFRYTYQFASDKELRRPSGSGNTLGSEKGVFNEKLGNKLLFDIDTDYVLNDWINFNAAYIFETIGEANYESEYGEENDWLAEDTYSHAHSLRFKGELTSVNLFMQKKFILPAQVKFYYQTTLGGVNTPDVDRYEVEFRMFF